VTFRPVAAELFQAERRKTDRRDEAKSRFPQTFEHT